jgi:DNA replicative helicase MCM subunit Mcm2 (Cdc46/Mcm family)
MRRWRTMQPDERVELETFILANNIVVQNEQRGVQHLTPELKTRFMEFWSEHDTDRLRGRDKILRSVCPQIYGMYLIKLALLLTLVGGVPSSDPTQQMKIRGQPHLLLVGDPGTMSARRADAIVGSLLLTVPAVLSAVLLQGPASRSSSSLPRGSRHARCSRRALARRVPA